MISEHLPPTKLLTEFCVSQPRHLTETGIAHLWLVRQENGESAVLKIYKAAHMGNEGPGFVFLDSLNGNGAVKIFKRNTTCALIEWLQGPSLGDLTRKREDERASGELVEVANKIHSAPQGLPCDLPLLEDWFAPLFACRFAPDCPPCARQNILKSQNLARALLTNQRDILPLHGDLHHDNIRKGVRGYLAFDAKGILGERTYELANAFRNPKGVPALVRDPNRIKFLRHLWAKKFCVDPLRLMHWTIAKSALSIVWRGAGTVALDPEFDLLDTFLSVVDG